MSLVRRLAPALVLVLASACRSTPDAASGPEIRDGVRVEVEADGRAVAPITSETLRATPPTFHDADHRAWRLASLLPAATVRPGMELEVEDEDGKRTILARLGAPDGSAPVLMVNRKGQVLIVLIDPANPFPAFHGRGGNRGQGGRANRIRGVVKLRLMEQ